jgi:NDP-sugar pyrophosphorylase family protein
MKASQLPSKAMLLAAGKGTRLGPLTQSIPKCMIPIGGRPMLQHTVEWLPQFNVTNLVINLHDLGSIVENHFGDGSGFGVFIRYSREPELLGTAGAVAHNEAYFGKEPFVVWYGDNLSHCDLDRMWHVHRRQGGIGTVALHYREDVLQCGIVGVDNDSRITKFVEKPRPEQVFSNWVSAGIMIFEPEILQFISPGFCDFGHQVLPTVLAKGLQLNAYKLSAQEGLYWIDRPEDLARVNLMVKKGLFSEVSDAMPVKQRTA